MKLDRKPRILVAEEDPQEVGLLSEALLRAGVDCDLIAADSGDQALEMLKKSEYDALVIDGTVKSLERADLLRSVTQLGNLAVVAHIGDPDPVNERMLKDLGIRSIVARRVDMGDFEELAALLGGLHGAELL